jgi:hypothetical protein
VRRTGKNSISRKTEPQSWRVVLVRSRGELLGFVDASDRTEAELVAVRTFNLSQEDRKRLLVRERCYYLSPSE